MRPVLIIAALALSILTVLVIQKHPILHRAWYAYHDVKNRVYDSLFPPVCTLRASGSSGLDYANFGPSLDEVLEQYDCACRAAASDNGVLYPAP